MRSTSPLSVVPAVVLSLTLATLTASAQSVKIEELARFSQPLGVNTGIAATPDGRIFTFGTGAGGFGGIAEGVANGAGGYDTVLAYAFTDAGELPHRSCMNSRCTSAITAGAGGVYFSGRYLSRFDPATAAVTRLHDFGSADEARALALGNDGQTLFGARSDGRIFRFDTVTNTYQDLANVGSDTIGVVQMNNGTLLVTINNVSWQHTLLLQLDAASGAEVTSRFLSNVNTSIPTKGDDGQIYAYAQTILFNPIRAKQELWRIDATCVCPTVSLLPANTRPSTIAGIRNGFIYYNVGGVRRQQFTTGVNELVTGQPVFEQMTMAPDGRLLIFVDPDFFESPDDRWDAIDTNTFVPGVDTRVAVARVTSGDGLNGLPVEVTEAGNGKVYGVSLYSMTLNASIFEIDPATGAKAIAATFEHREIPDFNWGGANFQAMVAAPDGRLYGLYSLRSTRLFRFDPATGVVDIIKEWNGGTDGNWARSLTLGRDGSLYGLLEDAGTTIGGSGIFRVDPATGSVTTIYGSSALSLWPNITEGAPGVWYGSTRGDWAPYCSHIYRFDQATGTHTIVKSLTWEEGCDPELVALPDGTLVGAGWYGPTPSDPNAWQTGVVFTVNPATGAYQLVKAYTSADLVSPSKPFAGADGFAYVYVMPSEAGATAGLVRVDPQSAAVTMLVPTTAGSAPYSYLKGTSGRIYAGSSSPASIFGIGVLDTIPVAPASGPFGGTTSVSATLKAIGVPLPGRTIAFTLNGNAIGSAITNASGVATITGVSLSGIAIGSHPAAIVASFAGDDAFPASTGAGALEVTEPPDVPTPGLMSGDGFIRDDGNRYDFTFVVREKADGTDRGWFVLKVSDDGKKPKKQKKGHHANPKPDWFVATSYTDVVFSDDPTIRPGRRHRPQVDTVVFAGRGTWNGASGYRFEAFAQDRGEPGRRRESLRVVVYDSANRVVVSFDDELSGGNVQSHRLRRMW